MNPGGKATTGVVSLAGVGAVPSVSNWTHVKRLGFLLTEKVDCHAIVWYLLKGAIAMHIVQLWCPVRGFVVLDFT